MIGYYNYTVYATYLSLAAAMSGVCLAMGGHIVGAAYCLLCCGAADMVDGRIARTHKTRTRDEKRFGVQIDSLSDLVAFGVLPAVIGFALDGATLLSAVTGVLFALAALIRLAYFNVLSARDEELSASGKMPYRGLPVPVIALAAPLLLCFHGMMSAATFSLCYALLLMVVGLLFICPFTLAKPKNKLLLALSAAGLVIFIILLVR